MELTFGATSAGKSFLDALIVSHDPALVEQVRGVFEEHSSLPVRMASSYREAHRLLECWRPSAVLIDFRASATAEDPTDLLCRLGTPEAHPIPVIAVSDAGYVCNWAGIADLIISGYVQLPLDRRQLARLLASQLARGTGAATAVPSAPRVVQGTTVTYKTYTPEMFGLLDDLLTVAGHDVTVLLVGETGTGKTTVARLLHELSQRHESKLLTVACGALPSELIESELFGHVKGAFTSAEQARLGKFEAAKGGTLLLDEIDVLGPSQQAKLLRVIETGEFEPVGSNETRSSKARLIVASNVDLKPLTDRNLFRADLYYRLSMLELRIPPLRERLHDIVPLALDFVEEFCKAYGLHVRGVHPEFLACLKRYGWPGNVRELKNHVRRAVLFCRSGILTPRDLASHFHKLLDGPLPAAPECRTAVPQSPRSRTFVEKIAHSEREILEQALREHNNNRTATAQTLGLSRVGLYKKMKRCGMVSQRPR